MINVVLPEKKEVTKDIPVNDIDQELFKLKVASFSERMNSRNAINPDIYYKACTKIRSLLAEEKKLNIKKYCEKINQNKINNDELYILYDNSYNLFFLYKIDNIYIRINVELVKNLTQEFIFFNKKITCETQVSINTVISEIPVKPGLEKCTIETFTTIFNEILEDLELNKIYDRSIYLVKKYISDEQNAAVNLQMETTKAVSASLDSIL
jgi:hypothetical protein